MSATINPKFIGLAKAELEKKQEAEILRAAEALQAKEDERIRREAEELKKKRAAQMPKVKATVAKLRASDDRLDKLAGQLADEIAKNRGLWDATIEQYKALDITDLNNTSSALCVPPERRVWRWIAACVYPVVPRELRKVDTSLRHGPTCIRERDDWILGKIGERYELPEV